MILVPLDDPLPADAARAKRESAAVQRKVHGLELAYLRDLVQELLAERDDLQERLAQAEHAADEWARMFHELTEQVAESDRAIGLTPSGEVFVMSPDAGSGAEVH